MKGCLKVVGYGLAALIVLGIIGSFLTRNTTPADRLASSATRLAEPAAVTSLPADTPTPESTATPEWMAPGFEEMCDNNDTMTDLQQEDWAKAMAGKQIVGWVGNVYDVQSGEAGFYTVQVDIDPGIFKARDVEILGVPRDQAAGLNVDQEIRFDGTIQSVDMFAEDICNPINVISATITTP